MLTLPQCLIATLLLPLLLTGCADKKRTVDKPPVAVELAVAATATVQDGIDVTGTLEPKFSVDVKTQVPGLIREVYVTQWVRVAKGQPLARIDLAETEAQAKRAEAAVAAAKAQAAQAQVTLTRAEREEARQLKLKEAGLATQQAVDDSRTETAAARARLAAAQAQVGVSEEEARQSRARLAKGLVTAPMDGVVALREVNVGDLAGDAAAGKPIFRIVDNRLLNLTVTVSSADSARVKTGQPLEFSVDALPGQTFRGRVMFINPELSSVDRSLKVVAEVKNQPELLKGGLFAKGRIITGSRGTVVQVPRSVLGAWDSTARTAVLFVAENDTARQRTVKTGLVSGDLVEIVEGLKTGEQYVVRGGFTLRDGDRILAQTPGAAR
ncbi:efflux RND transporter periplasmic adaptor subunit [Trichlorobacter ammonificans]|uniref:RND family efflux transporter, MFP subunit n=1 Tax=Trichlorobacter ammonificans TaxID=2916410 RepID=A0ABN8HH74_9BACT|nr:efflux RND transporter periplasmic adaptor subunit [Trichlorobacter ammonificans]CAH2030210.1 RND family efflux transporter, MFP subunit [Trichlorobacter ammonificans]